MSKLHCISPLGSTDNPATSENAQTTLVEEPHLGVQKLLSRGQSENDLAKVAKLVGSPLPNETGRADKGETCEVACVAPGEWLFIGNREPLEALMGQINEALSDRTILTCDLTDGRSSIVLSGTGSAAVLSAIMPLDFEAMSFDQGQCLTTAFGETTAFVQPLMSYSSAYRIIVDQSYARYAWRLLDDACQLAEATSSTPLSKGLS